MRAIRDSRNSTAQTMSSVTPRDLNLNQKNVDHIIEAMVGVTQEGTSRLSFANAPYLSAGKTGTAQAVTIGQNEKYDAKKLAEYERDHALYIAFAPTDAPEIALAIVVENAGFGSAHAAPIARRVFDYVLLGQYPSEADIAAVQQGQATAPIGEPRAVADVPLIRTVDPTTSE